MSKSALNAAGRSLAVDLRPRDIAVVLLHPGYVATPMTGDRGDVVAAVSAAGLFRRVIALNASASGSFIDYDGRQVPWQAYRQRVQQECDNNNNASRSRSACCRTTQEQSCASSETSLRVRSRSEIVGVSGNPR